MTNPMDDLRRAHRSLCSGFVSDELFRHWLGGGRADISRVVGYLRLPVRQRPALSWYFDPVFYLATNPDIAGADIDPLLHFIDTGIAELRSPHPLVDLRYILAEDALALGATPQVEALADLLEYDLVSPSPYFDPPHYLAQLAGRAPGNALLRHFLQHGLRAGRTPTACLDPGWYAARYPDVPDEPYAALRHFIMLGDIEGAGRRAGFRRQAVPDALYRRGRFRHPAAAPLSHARTARGPPGPPAERRAAATAGPVVSVEVGCAVRSIADELRARVRRHARRCVEAGGSSARMRCGWRRRRW